MTTLLALTLLAAAAAPGPAAEIPGLEQTPHWGATPEEVAKQFPDLKWTKGTATDEGLITAETKTKVAARDATLTFQFGKQQLAAVTVSFDPIASTELDYLSIASLIQTKGYTLVKAWKLPVKGQSEPRGLYQHNGSDVFHSRGVINRKPFHKLHSSDARRPDLGTPGPTYVDLKPKS
jgi:hypothetical protein